jgi:hypothetical protein
MKRLWIAFWLLLAPLVAQEQKKTEPDGPKVQKLFVLKYADPGRIGQLVAIFGASVKPDFDLRALAVAASAEVMPAIEEAIKRLDVPAPPPPVSPPPRNVELTAYYVLGGDAENPATEPIPKDLDNVVAQLKNTFPFKEYRLLDALTLRIRSGGGADTTGSPGTRGSGVITTAFRVNSATVSPDGATVRIDRIKASVRMPFPAPTSPAQFTYSDLGLSTDADVMEGQKVVIGRLGVGRDQALFLVLTARVVN